MKAGRLAKRLLQEAKYEMIEVVKGVIEAGIQSWKQIILTDYLHVLCPRHQGAYKHK